MKKAISSILITLLIMVLPALSAANSSAVAHHDDGSGSSFADTVDHHNHEHEGVAHHDGHGCCHGHVQVFSLPTSSVQPHYSYSAASHLTEYRFVVVAMSYFPEFRPPIA